ncbi:hypothetical protein OCU04_009269 [Sclerotinia nivalis]|uniref:Uncharacterized protein n=1 Tax=Sclerotinia nivalis TaxID=352851 RepID=A0A9X0AEU3_9HELO|nr:hypothetical protein OCU04_009269 [Sclerotinia nivalis]
MAFTTRSFSIPALSTPTPTPSPVLPKHKPKTKPRTHSQKKLRSPLQSNNPTNTNPNTYSPSPALPPTPRISKNEISSIEILTRAPMNLSISPFPGDIYASDREGIYSSGKTSISGQNSVEMSSDSGAGVEKRGVGVGVRFGGGQWRNLSWGVRFLRRNGRASL